mmetsp:Transcript_29869/g.72849  ORF Transcript_29869/g.72849 Transcript_29869/m.72849 type:complete len:82 (+) Transcript_29869:150-395(+)
MASSFDIREPLEEILEEEEDEEEEDEEEEDVEEDAEEAIAVDVALGVVVDTTFTSLSVVSLVSSSTLNISTSLLPSFSLFS